MPNIVAVCAMYHLDEMNKMLKIATSQAEDLGYNIVDVIEVPGCMEIPLALDRVSSQRGNRWSILPWYHRKRRDGPRSCHGSRCPQNHPRIAIGSQQTNRFGHHWSWCITRACWTSNWTTCNSCSRCTTPVPRRMIAFVSCRTRMTKWR